jgi:hypothetical protein
MHMMQSTETKKYIGSVDLLNNGYSENEGDDRGYLCVEVVDE